MLSTDIKIEHFDEQSRTHILHARRIILFITNELFLINNKWSKISFGSCFENNI